MPQSISDQFDAPQFLLAARPRLRQGEAPLEHPNIVTGLIPRAMAEQTKTGFVYIISNVGSFGEGVFKIGLTRRLDPLDRVREPGDASVPFFFDVHAIIYSDDAPALEEALHNEFDKVKINFQNDCKEFFRVALADVEAVVRKLAPDAPFIEDIEAQEYKETLFKRQQVLALQETKVESESPASI